MHYLKVAKFLETRFGDDPIPKIAAKLLRSLKPDSESRRKKRLAQWMYLRKLTGKPDPWIRRQLEVIEESLEFEEWRKKIDAELD